MKRIMQFLIFALFASSMALATAGEIKTVTLSVEGMTCSMCPITVKKALRKVDGVSEVSAKYEGKGDGWAKISYDAEKTNIEALTFATKEAGYPSTVKN